MEDDKEYRVMVFGKPGCDKCRTLNGRLDRLLRRETWAGFEKAYLSVDEEDGLVAFCQSECLNPQRIPAMLVMRRGADGRYTPVPNPRPGAPDPVCGASRLYQYVGLQTDYAGGGGAITRDMITTVLHEALTA